MDSPLLSLLVGTAGSFCMAAVFIGFIVSLAVGGYFGFRYLKGTTIKGWQEAADSLGVEFVGEGRHKRLQGEVNGRTLDVRLIGHGKFAQLQFLVLDAELGIHITATPTQMGRLMRGAITTVQPPEGAFATGDPSFDENYVVGSDDPEAARAWLGTHLGQLTLALREFDKVELTEGSLRALVKFDVRSLQSLGSWGRLALDSARAFSSSS